MTYTPPFAIEHRPSNFNNAFTRTFAPKVLQVVHVTGNKSVAAYPEGFDAKESPGADWLYAARNSASADGPSAHNYVGRETGATIEMWHPRTHVAWSNGDLSKPNLRLSGVAYLANLRAKGINANRGVYREIELSGYPGSFDPTDAQLEVAAYFAAIDSIATGLDIIRGVTMLTHADINSVDRQNCAFRATIRESRMAVICRRALEIRDLLQTDITAGEQTSVSFDILDNATVGTMTVEIEAPAGDHAYLNLRDGKLHPVADGFKKSLAFGPVLINTGSVLGDAFDDRTGYLTGLDAAFFKAQDVVFVPYSLDTTHTVTLNVDGQEKAKVVV